MTDADLPGPPPVRWGVIGATSRVAQLGVLPALRASPKAELVAVASLKHPDGTGYETFGARRTYGSYLEVLEDGDVEAVYIPLPNGMHAEWTVRAAQAGRHVLCEKPLATASAEAEEMAEACTEAGVLLMEAYMTPFHPRTVALEDMLRSRRLGALRSARACFTGILAPGDDYRWRPESGGGVLLDVGIYCLAPLLAAAASREPVDLYAGGMLARTGVDASVHGLIDFGKGFVGSFECSFETPERQVLEFAGKEGAIVVERPFTPGPGDNRIRVIGRDGAVEDVEYPPGDPYRGMVDHVAAVLRDSVDLRRSPAQSIELLRLLERIKKAATWAW